MFDLERWTEIWSIIKMHKFRTALTAFGVFWGIFMLVILLGAGKGLENGVIESFDVTKNSVFIWAERTTVPYNGFEVGRSVRFNNDDAEAIRKNLSDVSVVVPRNRLEGETTVSRNGRNVLSSVLGEHQDYIKIKPLILLQGRFLNAPDQNERRKVAVIGEHVKKALFGDDDPVGKYIVIKGVYFKVAGVFRGTGKGADLMEDAQIVFIPQATLQYCFNQVNYVSLFGCLPKNGVPAKKIETEIKMLLARRHHVAPDDLRAFGSSNVEKEFHKVQGLFQGIAIFSWVVSIGTILAGTIGVCNIMLIVVRERTREIGLRKALGATPWSIVGLVIQESVAITGIAGLAGLITGIGIVSLIDHTMIEFNIETKFFSHPNVDLNIAIAATAVLVAAGVFAGFIPASHAAAIEPIEALRDE